MTTVTPKGVEHGAEVELHQRHLGAMTTVTPKGVEHQAQPRPAGAVRAAMTTVTPKGVEHMAISYHPITLTDGDDHRDAERR